MPCTDSTTRGVPGDLHDSRLTLPAADGAHPLTAAICEHLLGDCFAASVERWLRTSEQPR